MNVVVFGASGATGRRLVRQLLDNNVKTRVVIRDKNVFMTQVNPGINAELLECIEGNITGFEQSDYEKLIGDYDVVVSCLGHNITLSGIFGQPRMLVTDAVRNITEALLKTPRKNVKFVLMNTVANRNRANNEKYDLKDRIILKLIRWFLPPHKDNECAAMYLLNNQQKFAGKLEWVAVRPDGLIEEKNVSEYEVFETTQRSPIFNPGKTSRINVAHFMYSLIADEELWNKWKSGMPVLYNK